MASKQPVHIYYLLADPNPPITARRPLPTFTSTRFRASVPISDSDSLQSCIDFRKRTAQSRGYKSSSNPQRKLTTFPSYSILIFPSNPQRKTYYFSIFTLFSFSYQAMASTTMKGWQYTKTAPNLEIQDAITLETSIPAPTAASLSKNQILISVVAAAINPADYKMYESGGLIGRAMIHLPGSTYTYFFPNSMLSKIVKTSTDPLQPPVSTTVAASSPLTRQTPHTNPPNSSSAASHSPLATGPSLSKW